MNRKTNEFLSLGFEIGQTDPPEINRVDEKHFLSLEMQCQCLYGEINSEVVATAKMCLAVS